MLGDAEPAKVIFIPPAITPSCDSALEVEGRNDLGWPPSDLFSQWHRRPRLKLSYKEPLVLGNWEGLRQDVHGLEVGGETPGESAKFPDEVREVGGDVSIVSA